MGRRIPRRVFGRLTTPPALRQVASATWRELIKRIWEVDPLLCPRCGTEMAKIAVLKDPVVITKILRHLNLWEEPPARGPPPGGTVYEPCYDDPPAAAEANDQASAADVQVSRPMLSTTSDPFRIESSTAAYPICHSAPQQRPGPLPREISSKYKFAFAECGVKMRV